MCLLDNLADSADCGGLALSLVDSVHDGYLTWAWALIGHYRFVSEARLAPGFPVLYSYLQYKCTAASLGIEGKGKVDTVVTQYIYTRIIL
jgi:hypothetical protein